MNNKLNLLLFLHFLNDGIRTTFIVLLPFIAKDFYLHYTQVGFLSSSQPIMATILAIPAGIFAVKFGGFKILKTTLLFYSLAGVILSFLPPNIFFIFLLFYVASLSFGMFHTIGFTLIARNSTSNIGKNMGNFTSIGDIGRILVSSIALFITPLFGWRISLSICGVIGILTYIAIQLIPRNQQINREEKMETIRGWINILFEIFHTKKLRLVAIVAMIDTFASNQLFIFLPFFLLNQGVSTKSLVFFTSAYFAGNLLGKNFLGRLTDKFGNRKMFIISEIAMAAILIFITITSTLTLIFLLTLFLGIFTKGTSPIVQTMFSETTHQLHYEKAYALSEIFIGTAAFIATSFMGILGDKFGIKSIFYLSSFAALTAILPFLIVHLKTKRQFELLQ